MKILPLVNEVRNNIASSGIRLKQATKSGYRIADRTSQIYKQNSFKKYIAVARSVSSKVVKGTTSKELPYVAGAIGMIIPLPLASPIMMGLGFIASFSISGKSLLRKNKNTSKSNPSLKV